MCALFVSLLSKLARHVVQVCSAPVTPVLVADAPSMFNTIELWMRDVKVGTVELCSCGVNGKRLGWPVMFEMGEANLRREQRKERNTCTCIWKFSSSFLIRSSVESKTENDAPRLIAGRDSPSQMRPLNKYLSCTALRHNGY